MRKHHLTLPLLLIPIISLLTLFGVLLSIEAEPLETNAGIKCGEGTEPNEFYTQCVLSCPDGEIVDGDICTSLDEGFTDTHGIIIGIFIAAGATVSGIFLTVIDRRKQDRNRLQELIKLYSDEIREITNQESHLDTKQACSLYVEQYLDTLEQIATLKEQKVIKDGAIDYFNNNFAYGIDLWWWHNDSSCFKCISFSSFSRIYHV